MNLLLEQNNSISLELSDKPFVDWFAFKKDNCLLSCEDYLLLAKNLELSWRLNNPNAPKYLNPKNLQPEQTYQYKAVINILYNILRGKNSLLLSATRTGKTFMLFYVLEIINYYNYFKQLQELENATYPIKVVYFTPPSIIDQTKEVKALFPNLNKVVLIAGYQTLSSKNGLGNIFLQWNTKVIHGEITLEPEWIDITAPPVILCDEVQYLKNNTSKRTQLIQAYNRLKSSRTILQISASATPFVKPSESKTICLSLSPLLELTDENRKGLKKVFVKNEAESTTDKLIYDAKIKKITNLPRVSFSNFEYFLKDTICGNRIDPTDYSPAAMSRLTDYLSSEDQLVTVTDVDYKHKTVNKQVKIKFQTPQEAKAYSILYETYINNLLKLDKNIPGGMAAIFVEMTAYKKGTQIIRAPHLARIGYQKMLEGNNVIIATSYLEAQDKIYDDLINIHKLSPDKISIIRGGQRKINTKSRNDFQDEKTNILLIMDQAGGIGISLHQYNERNKRPRFVLLPPVWGIIDMLQVLGRAHGPNSDSTTHQWVLWYEDTIEESICERLAKKSLSMRELMRKKEQWSEMFVNEALRERLDLKKFYEEEKTETINNKLKLNNNDNNDNNDEENEIDAFNLDEEAIANNMVIEV